MKMKILIFAKSIDGGTGTYLIGLQNIKKLFKNHELAIKVLVIDKPQFRSNYSKEYIFFRNNPVTKSKYGVNLATISQAFRETLWLKKEIHKFNPNMVFSLNFYAIVISELTKIITLGRYKTINFIQNNLEKVVAFKSSKHSVGLVRLLTRYLLKRSDRLISVSEELSKDMVKELKLNRVPTVIPTTIKTLAISRVKRSDENLKTIIVTVARLDLQKDHETLIRAFNKVSNICRNCELWIVGDGPSKANLESLSESLGLSQKIIFLGWVQSPSKFLKESQIFVLSSKWEGFPLSLLEAMSVGLPCISTNCKYGPSEIIQNNKFGILVPGGSVGKLSESIISLVKNRDLQKHYSEMSLLRAKDYSAEKTLPLIRRLIEEIHGQ